MVQPRLKFFKAEDEPKSDAFVRILSGYDLSGGPERKQEPTTSLAVRLYDYFYRARKIFKKNKKLLF